jgi:hypothetical protein
MVRLPPFATSVYGIVYYNGKANAQSLAAGVGAGNTDNRASRSAHRVE